MHCIRLKLELESITFAYINVASDCDLSEFGKYFPSDNLPQSGDDGAKAPGSSRSDKEVPKGDVKITGKNTQFAPRSVVKPLGWTTKDEKPDGGAGELKSNEEFRNLLLKK